MKINSGSVSGGKIIRWADKGVLFACIGAIAVVYILDALFFAAWAPERYLIPVFMAIGIVIRTIAVFAGVSLQWVRGRREIRGARATIRALWVFCVLVCLVPAMSFFAGGHKKAQSTFDVAAAVETASVESKAVRIARIESQIDRTKEDRDASVEEANQTIQAITNDGVAGISASDNQSIARLREEIQGYRSEANTKITDFEAAIGEIEREREDVQTQAAEDKQTVSSFSAIFHVIGEVTGTDHETWSIGVLFAFALLIEAIAAFGLGAYYDIHRIFVQIMQDIEITEAQHDVELQNIGANNAEEDEIPRQVDDIQPAPERPDATAQDAQEENDEEGRPQLTSQQQRSRKGGRANGHYNEAIKDQTKIPVRDMRSEGVA